MGGDQRNPAPNEAMTATPQDNYQPDVLMPDTGAGNYWYVDPRALGQQQMAQGPTQTASAGQAIVDAFQRMFGPDQSDLTYRPSSSQQPYDPMAQVRQNAQQQKEMESMFHEMGPEDVFKTVSVDFNGKRYEAPAVFDNMTDSERNIIQYLPHTQWPSDIHKKIQQNAFDNLTKGLDPFGNPLSSSGVRQHMEF